MTSKVAGVLIICLVLATTFGTGEAIGELMDAYRKCFVDCHQSCEAEGLGSTFCEMRCDGECMTQETAGKRHQLKLFAPPFPSLPLETCRSEDTPLIAGQLSVAGIG
ncbi:hypothetical protein BT93_H2089 [Corymbia citriodora subsp. variegata]|nr:hypothetical protein BT93_H2089 [Corymbia citriodora subsp. variegata]